MTAQSAAWRGRFDRRDVVAVGALLAIGVVLPTLVAAATGSLDIPRNDDWSYRRLAIHLFQTGRIDLDGSVAAALIGQIVIAQPFLWLSGGQTWGLSIAGIFFATAATMSGYLILRRFLSSGRATLAILLLVLFPGYLPYAVSFMTDVPALAAEFICLGLGLVAVGRRPIRFSWLVASLVIGLFGFTIREFAIAAPMSVLFLAVVIEPRRKSTWLAGAAFVLACVGFYLWRSSLPGQVYSAAPIILSPYLTDRLLRAISSAAFVLLPAVVLSWPRLWARLRLLDAGIGVVIGLLIVGGPLTQLVTTGSLPAVLLNQVITEWGTPSYYMMVAGRPLLIPDPIWPMLNGLALVATVLAIGTGTAMVGAIVRDGQARRLLAGLRSGSPLWLLALFAGGMAVILALLGSVSAIIDRYLWALIPPLAALVLAFGSEPAVRAPLRAPRWGAAVAGILLTTIVGMMSMVFLLNSDAFDGARWRGGQALVDAGVPAESVDAGFEWVGYYAPGLADFSRPGNGLTWYQALWPAFHMCGFVASAAQDVPDARLIDIETQAYRLLGFTGLEEPFYLYRIVGPGCPPAT